MCNVFPPGCYWLAYRWLLAPKLILTVLLRIRSRRPPVRRSDKLEAAEKRVEVLLYQRDLDSAYKAVAVLVSDRACVRPFAHLASNSASVLRCSSCAADPGLFA